MTKKGRIFAGLLLWSLATLAMVTSTEIARHRRSNQQKPPEEGSDVEQ